MGSDGARELACEPAMVRKPDSVHQCYEEAIQYSPSLCFGLSRHLVSQSWKHLWYMLLFLWMLQSWLRGGGTDPKNTDRIAGKPCCCLAVANAVWSQYTPHQTWQCVDPETQISSLEITGGLGAKHKHGKHLEFGASRGLHQWSISRQLPTSIHRVMLWTGTINLVDCAHSCSSTSGCRSQHSCWSKGSGDP